MMSLPVVWIHADCLNPHQAALQRHPESPAIFVWDEDLLRHRQLSLKRIVFIYECLLELPLTIQRGDVSAEIIAFAAKHRANTVVTTHSVSPGFNRICQALRQHGLSVELYEAEPFVTPPREPDLRRFSRYWRAVKPYL